MARISLLAVIVSSVVVAAGCQQRPAAPDPPQTVGAGASGSSSASPQPGQPGLPSLWSFSKVRTTRPAAAVESADLDGDGDRDIVVLAKLAAQKTELHLLRNDGRGHFEANLIHSFPSVRSQHSQDLCALTLTDADGDGDLDLVFGAMDPQGERFDLHLLKNDGKGAFSPAGG